MAVELEEKTGEAGTSEDEKKVQEPEKVEALEEWYPKDLSQEQIKAINDNLSGMRGALKGHKEEKAKRNDADAERKKKEDDAKAARQAEDDKKLEDSKEFEKLAGERKTKLDELGPQVDTLTDTNAELMAKTEALLDVVKKHLASVRGSLELKPAMVILLDKMDPVEQLSFIADNADELGAKEQGPVPPAPKGKGSGKMSHEEKLEITYKTHM